jgi:hypothetical protein
MGDPGNTGFNILAGAIGFALAAIGFLVLRDPVKVALFSGYTGSEVTRYRRLTRQWSHRIGLRLFGAIIALFGLVILTAVLRKFSTRLGVVSDGLFIAMSVVFYCAFFGGLGFTVVTAISRQVRTRGAASSRKHFEPTVGIVEEAAESHPAMTAAMQKERRIFTAVFLFLVGATVVASLNHGSPFR